MEIETFSLDSNPYGKSWQLWVTEWWKWCYTKPLSSSPVGDIDGRFADRYQDNQEVWFLGGTFGGHADRKCSIPYPRALFFPIVNDLINFKEYKQLKTESDLRSYSKADLDSTSLCEVKVDDYILDKMHYSRFQTKPFHIALPETAEGQVYTDTVGVSDGFWVFIKSLPVGNHSLLIKGEKLAYDDYVSSGSPDPSKKFIVSVMYTIEVKKE